MSGHAPATHALHARFTLGQSQDCCNAHQPQLRSCAYLPAVAWLKEESTVPNCEESLGASCQIKSRPLTSAAASLPRHGIAHSLNCGLVTSFSELNPVAASTVCFLTNFHHVFSTSGRMLAN
ncbi:hypothetical protein GQ55_9G145600 [Panicum hallii var. hallii]|uniref:Uncharacterized protein n=1 Tax=Panicum hallii var. hallii TaxID=1504633 RepID=A0A2T7C336_9POAL|nr:hypothetical protein GQ55_9G145600 [Panicum hallii var. hallii]